MTLFVTLFAGLPFVLLGLLMNHGRAARGLAGAEVWVQLWVLGAALLVTCRRHARGVRSGTPGDPWRFRLALARVLGVWTVACIATVSARRSYDFGLGGATPLGLGLVVAGVFLAVAPRLARRQAARTGGDTRRASPPDAALLRACTPMLLPAVALLVLRSVPPAERFGGLLSPPSLSGILVLQLETVAFPALLLVSWALDRTDGSRGSSAARGLAFTCVAFLVVTSVVPVFLQPESSWTTRAPAPGGTGLLVHRFDLDGLTRSTSIMLLACSGLTIDQLARVRRGCAPIGWRGSLALAALSAGPGALLALRMGPSAAPLAVTAACLAVAAVQRRVAPVSA